VKIAQHFNISKEVNFGDNEFDANIFLALEYVLNTHHED
jgi:hypothetical protein